MAKTRRTRKDKVGAKHTTHVVRGVRKADVEKEFYFKRDLMKSFGAIGLILIAELTVWWWTK